MTTRSALTLTGDHNQCPGCGELFNSTYAFEKHRVGDHDSFSITPRRCLGPAEMEAEGMSKNRRGWWISSARDPEGSAPSGDRPGSPG